MAGPSVDRSAGGWETRINRRWLRTPAVAGGRRVFAAHSSEHGWALTALALETGEPLWSRRLPANALDAPVVAGRSVYVATVDGHVCSFGVRTGRRAWCTDVAAVGAPTPVGDELRVVTWPRGSNGRRYHLTLNVEGYEPGRRELFHFMSDHLSDFGACGWDRPTTLHVAIAEDGTLDIDSSEVPGDPGSEGSPRACVDALFADLHVGPIERAVVHEVRLARGEQEVVRLSPGDGAIRGRMGRVELGRVPEMAARGGGTWLWHYEGPRIIASADQTIEVVGDRLRIRDQKSVFGADALRWERAEPEGLTLPVPVEDRVVVGTGAGDLVVYDRASGRELSRTPLGVRFASQPVVWNGWVYSSTAEGRVIARDLRAVLGTERSYPMWGGSAARSG